MLKPMTEIVEGQRFATAAGSWTHTIDLICSSGSGELEWLTMNSQMEMTPHDDRSKRVLESAAKMQGGREAGGLLWTQFLQVYTYILEDRARLA